MIQTCPTCHFADDVTYTKTGGEFVYTCDNPKHGPISWRKPATNPATNAREGYLIEHGVYGDLLSCVRADDPWLEYGVVEHRYRILRPQTYATLVRSYSHAARNAARGGTIATPDRSMTTSRRLSGALSQLAEEGLLSSRKGRASGFWSYNSDVSHYGPVPAPAGDAFLSWVAFATKEGLDPQQWILPESLQ